MKIETLVLGGLETNCYLVYDEAERRGFLVDPADDALNITAKLNALGVTPEAVLLTHGHVDHIMAADELRSFYQIPVLAHEAEAALLEDPMKNLSGLWAAPYRLKADRLLKDHEKLTIAGMELEVFHTPGHTKGGVCYYLEKEGVLLAGDTLFCESYGRTDFPGGSFGELRNSITNILFLLPDEVTVYSGHSAETTIGHEKRYNPMAVYTAGGGWQ